MSAYDGRGPAPAPNAPSYSHQPQFQPPPGWQPPPPGWQPPPPGWRPPPPGWRPAPPGWGAAHFLGREGDFLGLLIRGSLLLMLTLGIYRFWLNTDVRRFLWGNTEIAGDGLEYAGTARELLLGFLMAIALLAPINVLFFLATFDMTLLPYVGAIGFVALALLGQFAFFRARRYRLTRTIYRGVRFFQTGSAWNYSIRSNLWLVLIVLTLGLAYPFAQANLERYKMRHTHFGNLDGQFVGSGTQLFARGFLMWLAVVGPIIAGVVLTIAALDWNAVLKALGSPSSEAFTRLGDSAPALVGALGLLGAAVGWSTLAAFLLYPVFRAMLLRWWVAGVRIGGVATASRLRTGQVYGVYAKFVGWSMLFGIGASIVFGLGAGFFWALASDFGSSSAFEIAAVVATLAVYVIMMLGYSVIYQTTVTLRLWRLSFETTDLSGLEALDWVQARGHASGSFGEGLADALDVGGI